MVIIVKPPHELGVRRPEWRALLRRDPCSSYHDGPGGTVDHIVPKANGGRDQGARNVVGACQPCNSDKSDTPLLLWLLERPSACAQRDPSNEMES